MAVNENVFPNLLQLGYRITSPPDPVYNCISHAAGVTNVWWWPDPDGFEYWPPGVVRERTLVAFTQAFGTLGYVPCGNGVLEPGWEKIAIYETDEGPTHAARQLENGLWTSKLGPDDDIEHVIEGLVGASYGSVVQFLRRAAGHA
jgi:hypothetical protein